MNKAQLVTSTHGMIVNTGICINASFSAFLYKIIQGFVLNAFHSVTEPGNTKLLVHCSVFLGKKNESAKIGNVILGFPRPDVLPIYRLISSLNTTNQSWFTHAAKKKNKWVP